MSNPLPPPLPCAHCAKEAKLEQDIGTPEKPGTMRWAVYCTEKWCGICTPLCSTPDYALQYWNRRDWVKPANDSPAFAHPNV